MMHTRRPEPHLRHLEAAALLADQILGRYPHILQLQLSQWSDVILASHPP